MVEPDQCVTCLEPFDTCANEEGSEDSEVRVLECGHYFHKECLKRWEETSSNLNVSNVYVSG